MMAIPAKRRSGQEVTFCGLHWYSNNGFVALPVERKTRLLADLTCYVEQTFDRFPNDFENYRSLVGKLVSALPLTQLDRTALHGLYEPFARCNKLGPASVPILSGFSRGQLKEWRGALERSSACPLTQNRVGLPLCPSSFTIVYADARKDDAGASMGWYFHGFWTGMKLSGPLVQLHITHIEALAGCCGLLDCCQITGSNTMLVQVDASASSSTLSGAAHAIILQRIHHTFMQMELTRGFCNTSAVSLVKGLVNVMADLPSRLEADKMVAIGRLDGLKLNRFEPREITLAFLRDVERVLTPLEQFRSQAVSLNDAGDGPNARWLDDFLTGGAGAKEKRYSKATPTIRRAAPSASKKAVQRRWDVLSGHRKRGAVKQISPNTGHKAVLEYLTGPSRLEAQPLAGSYQAMLRDRQAKSRRVSVARDPGGRINMEQPPLLGNAGLDNFWEKRQWPIVRPSTYGTSQSDYASTLSGLRDRSEAYLSAQPKVDRGAWKVPQMSERRQQRYRALMDMGTPDNTIKQDQSGWRKWQAFCRFKGVQPLRMDMSANTGLNIPGQYEEQMLQMEFVLWQEEWVEGRTGLDEFGRKKKALPATLLANLRSVRRIHRKLRFPMAPVPTLADIEKGLNTAFSERYGTQALVKKAKTPFTREAITRIVGMLPNVVLPHCKVGDHTWFSFKAAVCLAAATGMRIDEFTCNARWTKKDGARSHLSWIFQGRHYKSLSRVQLMQLGWGDTAVVIPVPAKADRHLKYFGSKPMYFPFGDSTFNAAAALRDLELSFPVPPDQRNRYPFFPNNSVARAWTVAELRATFRAALVRVLPPQEAKLYSWHSFRVYLACAMQVLRCSDAEVQAFVRWRSPKSIPYYQQLGRQQYEDMMRRLANVEVDAGLLERLPVISEETELAGVAGILPAAGALQAEEVNDEGWESDG